MDIDIAIAISFAIVLVGGSLFYFSARVYSFLTFIDVLGIDLISIVSSDDPAILRDEIGRKVVERIQLFNHRAQHLLRRARPELPLTFALMLQFAENAKHSVFVQTSTYQEFRVRMCIPNEHHTSSPDLLFEHRADQMKWQELVREMNLFAKLMKTSLSIAMKFEIPYRSS